MIRWFIATALAAVIAPVQAKELVGISGDWGAFKGGAACYVVSAPKSGAASRPGTQLAVTQWRGVGTQIMVSAGAPLRSLTLRAGGQRFELTPRAGDAWLPDARGDAMALSALMASTTATVDGRTSRGTRIADSYTLSGFSEAWALAQKACR